MAMTKRQFEQLARILRENQPEEHDSTEHMWLSFRREIVEMCQQENPRFDVPRFVRASEHG